MVRLKLDDAANKGISEAVAAAERKTSGEIVVVVDRRAGRYGDTIAFASLAVVALLYAVGNYRLFSFGGDEPRWEYSPDLAMAPLPTFLTWAGGFVVMWFLFEWLHPALRPFVSPARMREEAQGAAWRAFGERSVHATQADTGVLIFVSEFERTVVVLGDKAIDAKLTQGEWESVRDAVLDGYRANAPLDGLTKAIALAGDLLARHFPKGDGDRQELPDAPHLQD